jgi:cell wall assembly regulator SMI1
MVDWKSSLGRIEYRSDPETESCSVGTAWARLKKWASVHLPTIIESLNPPASSDQLRKFEDSIKVKLPQEVWESYQVHNGQGDGPGIVYGLPILPLDDCLHNWRGWAGYEPVDYMDEGCCSFPSEFVRQAYFDPGWIPLTDDSGGNHIGIDLNPGQKGTAGQVIVFGPDDELHTVLARNWRQFLADLAGELERGNFRIDASSCPVGDKPKFLLDDPHRKHFHGAGIFWSCAKLGLRSLSESDQELWKNATQSM